jgi:hypothetical protein
LHRPHRVAEPSILPALEAVSVHRGQDVGDWFRDVSRSAIAAGQSVRIRRKIPCCPMTVQGTPCIIGRLLSSFLLATSAARFARFAPCE